MALKQGDFLLIKTNESRTDEPKWKQSVDTSFTNAQKPFKFNRHFYKYKYTSQHSGTFAGVRTSVIVAARSCREAGSHTPTPTRTRCHIRVRPVHNVFVQSARKNYGFIIFWHRSIGYWSILMYNNDRYANARAVLSLRTTRLPRVHNNR